MAGTNLVIAQIEQQQPGFGDETLGWNALGPEIPLAGTVEAGSQATWSGTVAVPPHDPGVLHLVLKEFELHPGDSPDGELVEVRRMVHLDVLAL